MEVGGRGRLYTYRYTVTTRMTPALRWAAMRDIFNVSVRSEGQSHRTVSTNHNLFEQKGEPKSVSNRGPSAYQPNALPLGQTGSIITISSDPVPIHTHRPPSHPPRQNQGSVTPLSPANKQLHRLVARHIPSRGTRRQQSVRDCLCQGSNYPQATVGGNGKLVPFTRRAVLLFMAAWGTI